MFTDTHAHLTDEAFKNEESQIVANAKNCGVGEIITSGFDLASSIDALNFANKFDCVFASIGVYPENSEEYNDEVEKKLTEMAKKAKVVAIGEIGLKYTDGMPDKEKQKEVFLKQLRLAHSLKKPIVIHCREAFGDMMQILRENRHLLDFGGTFHCFTGNSEIAKEAIKLGFYFSVGGVSTFKNAKKIIEVVESISLDNIILETDCPYLSPHPFRGQRNEPSRIVTIAEKVAEIKGVSLEEVERKTNENVRRLFNI